jgi:AhpD family alkylhydroperoxidase
VVASGLYANRTELVEALGLTAGASLFTPAVAELVAIGAAIAANCEPCLKHHYRQAQLLGISKADMASAVQMAAKVKDSPHQAILRLAKRLTGSSLNTAEAASDLCCGAPESRGAEPASSCCG